ncbi:MAG: VOC family protein [Patescibacteria group bacterium]
MNMKLELVAVPVSDVDKAKTFYENIFGPADMDAEVNPDLRFIQFTPPGSACSICIGKNIAGNMKPGSVEGLQLVVENINEARSYLESKGLSVGDVDVQEWGKFVYFTDPDGNGWAVQELPDYTANPNLVKTG